MSVRAAHRRQAAQTAQKGWQDKAPQLSRRGRPRRGIRRQLPVPSAQLLTFGSRFGRPRSLHRRQKGSAKVVSLLKEYREWLPQR